MCRLPYVAQAVWLTDWANTHTQPLPTRIDTRPSRTQIYPFLHRQLEPSKLRTAECGGGFAGGSAGALLAEVDPRHDEYVDLVLTSEQHEREHLEGFGERGGSRWRQLPDLGARDRVDVERARHEKAVLTPRRRRSETEFGLELAPWHAARPGAAGALDLGDAGEHLMVTLGVRLGEQCLPPPHA